MALRRCGSPVICRPRVTVRYCFACRKFIAAPGPRSAVFGGRLAAADFVLAAHSTSDVPVGLTALGQQVASAPGYEDARVLVDLLDYGVVFYATSPTGKYVLTSTDPPLFPAGTATHCGTIVFASANTSCPFAENVLRAYIKAYGHNAGGVAVTASSPVTGQTYTLQCASQSPIQCTGGNNARVAFYD
jgi:hypothetical protein